MSEPSERFRALLLGGRFDRIEVWLSAVPARIEASGQRYDRLDDPDTGEYLGAYVAQASDG